MLRHWKTVAMHFLADLKKKPLRYWISALFVFLLSYAGSKSVYEFFGLEKARAVHFQYLLDHGPRPPKPRFVSVVLINDDEYWNGDPAGRAPLNRAYLTRVVDGLVAANVHVIALDVDVRLPNPESMQIPSAYKEETCKLIEAIKRGAGAGKKFVLATPISFDEQKRYRRDTDIYQSNGLCERRDKPLTEQKSCGLSFKPEEKANVTCGYIALPYDILAIPGWIDTSDGDKLDSFALAIARAERPALVDDSLWQKGATVRYANYISESRFEQSKAKFSTTELLIGSGKINLQNGAVIVGAGWSTFALGRGPGIDLHQTPLGDMAGTLLHANFAEALLDSRTTQAAPEWFAYLLEGLFSLVAALILAVISSVWGKVGALLSLFAMLFFLQWAILHGIAMFFDAFFPVFSLGLHSLYEKVFGFHKSSQRPG